MKKKQDRRGGRRSLRRRAEAQLIERGKAGRERPESHMTAVDMERLVQELQIHQIELEMQNEELKKARDEAEAERERYLDLYDFAPVGYFTLVRRRHPSGEPHRGAPAGHGALRLLNRRFGHFVSRPTPRLRRLPEKGLREPGEGELHLFPGQAGQQRSHVQIEASRLRGRAGVPAAVLDWTERKKAEDELRKLHGELEQQGAQHTAQLEAANKELDSFRYSISHDLQTPLRAIDGYSRMILRRQGERFDEETRNKFEVIRSNIEKMGQLIGDILTFSRLGRRPLSLTVDMDAVVMEVWDRADSRPPRPAHDHQDQGPAAGNGG